MLWIEQKVVICQDAAERQRMGHYISPAADLFPELVEQLEAVFVYRCEEQTGEAAELDGILLRNESGAGKPFAVGLSVWALDQGESYAATTFLRALAHIEEPGNGGRYHSILSDMIFRYNRACMDALAADMSDKRPRGRL